MKNKEEYLEALNFIKRKTEYDSTDEMLTGNRAVDILEKLINEHFEEAEYVKTENPNDIFVTITCNKCHFHMFTSKDKDLSDLNFCPYCGRKIVR